MLRFGKNVAGLSALCYSVDIQTILFYVAVVLLALLVPFSTASETESINFVHDFIFGTGSVRHLAHANLSSFIYLCVTYAPLRAITRLFPSIPTPYLRCIVGACFTACWRMLQTQIYTEFGPNAAFVTFIISIQQWTVLDQAIRLTDRTVICALTMVSAGFWMQRNLLSSLMAAFVCLPMLKTHSLSFLLALSPMFLSVAAFDFDSLSMFAFLSIAAVVATLTPSLSLDIHALALSVRQLNPNVLLIPMALLNIRPFGTLRPLRLFLCYGIGAVLFRNMYEPVFIPFLVAAAATAFVRLSSAPQPLSKDTPSSNPARRLQTVMQCIAVLLAIQLAVSVRTSMLSFAGGHGSFHLSDLLRDEATQCDGPVRAHVSRDVVATGFSKFLTVRDANIQYEFGTQYNEHEMLQKFKFRVASIDEHVDPAYWRTFSVHYGLKETRGLKMRLSAKILIRHQPTL